MKNRNVTLIVRTKENVDESLKKKKGKKKEEKRNKYDK